MNSLIQGVYQFELKVTDKGDLFAKDTMQITVNNNLAPYQILSGQELIFYNKIWSYDFDGAAILYIGVENRSDLFSFDRPLEVSMKFDSTNSWIPVPERASNNSLGYVYAIYSNSSFVFPSPHIFPWSANTQIAGAKISLKVKFYRLS